MGFEEDVRSMEKEIRSQALPCPFCGSEKIQGDPIPDEMDGIPYSQLKCGECGATGPEVRGYLEDWIEAWNTRSGPPQGLSFVLRSFDKPYATIDRNGNILKVKHRPKDPKPCPFCTSRDLEVLHIEDTWIVHCLNCDGWGPWASFDYEEHDTRKKAESRWNQRSNSNALSSA